MQNGETQDASAAAKPTEPAKPEEVTKRSLRQKIWKHLESNGLAVFPRPVFQRIPNFKGAQEAAEKLAELDVFKNAANIWVNPDKPQEFVRTKVLEHKKTLYVPATRQQDGYLCRVDLPEGETDYKMAVSRKGIEDFGKSIGIEELVSLDMVVTGSVCVSKEGYRVGNGRGYSDLEFALMVHMKAIQPSTIVVTVVHDCQVLDSMPAELFGPHDVPIDIIVTPTQVIRTQRMSQRPTGLFWHLLSNRRLQNMPVLSKLREMEILAGRPCPLKEVDTDPEERTAMRIRRRVRRRTHSQHRKSESTAPAAEGEQTDRKQHRPSRRRNSNKSAPIKPSEGDAGKPRRPRKPRLAIDFSVKVSNISPNTRVRDLKQALSDRGVKPQLMIWKGFRGYCYLHFIKSNNQKQGDGDGAEVTVISMESVLDALKDVQVTEGGAGGAGGEGEPAGAAYSLQVEAAPPRPPPAAKQEQILVPTADATAV